jgi:hypothetical protein
MEILILGVILVALMAYVSTRIKKSAARAFEREVIETEDFRLVKPEGFLNPVNGNSEYAFEAYSKDFGEDDAAEYRQAEAVVRVHQNSEPSENLPAENEKIEKGVTIQTFHKLLRHDEKAYELEISVLKEKREQYLDKINEMLNSFSLK